MKMKYFRFLYGETRQCFLHFGELQDTTTKEDYTFLYLRKMEKHVDQTNSERRLFLFPERVNLVILGSTDAESFQVLAELLREFSVDTLILSANTQFAIPEKTERIGEIVRIGEGIYQIRRAGWHVLVRSFQDGTTAMAHGLPAEDREGLFEDCVMCVKELREDALCRKGASPDGYGCAMGCALHQDYDVCRYRGSDGSPVFGTGTVIFGGEEETACRELLKEAQKSIGEIRFFCLADGRLSGQARSSVIGGTASGSTVEFATGRNRSGLTAELSSGESSSPQMAESAFGRGFSGLTTESAASEDSPAQTAKSFAGEDSAAQTADSAFGSGFSGQTTESAASAGSPAQTTESVAEDSSSAQNSAADGQAPGEKSAPEQTGACGEDACPEAALCSGGFRRYLIGTEELDDEAAASLGRGGWNRRPVILKDGEGICCSGFLKYTL